MALRKVKSKWLLPTTINHTSCHKIFLKGPLVQYKRGFRLLHSLARSEWVMKGQSQSTLFSGYVRRKVYFVIWGPYGRFHFFACTGLFPVTGVRSKPQLLPGNSLLKTRFSPGQQPRTAPSLYASTHDLSKPHKTLRCWDDLLSAVPWVLEKLHVIHCYLHFLLN